MTLNGSISLSGTGYGNLNDNRKHVFFPGFFLEKGVAAQQIKKKSPST